MESGRIIHWQREGNISETGKVNQKQGAIDGQKQWWGRSVNWEDEWEEEKGLVVRELGRRMVTEE